MGVTESIAATEWISVPGYARVHEDGLQLHNRFAVHHRGRIWVVRCSVKNDMALHPLPESERSIRPFELFVLGCDVLLHDFVTMLRRATNGLHERLCQSNTGDLHRGR